MYTSYLKWSWKKNGTEKWGLLRLRWPRRICEFWPWMTSLWLYRCQKDSTRRETIRRFVKGKHLWLWGKNTSKPHQNALFCKFRSSSASSWLSCSPLQCIYIYWLVVWNIFSIIYGIICPNDKLIFFKMVKTTNQYIISYIWVNYNDLTVLPHWNHG